MVTKNKTKKSEAGILGFGEVGKAIAKFYGSNRFLKAKIKDLNRDDGLEGVEVLHVCIPWSDKFIEIAKKEIERIKPKISIIHSTVALGTTKKLADMFNGAVVHSPIRGVHPFLHEGVKTFVKYIGADDKKTGLLAEKYLKILGIKIKLCFPSAVTEALKIWDTTQYGVMIALNKEIKEWCDKNSLDFGTIYTDANKTYNDGYKKLGRPEVARPYLKYIPGKIGGHCVIPNAKILKKYYKSEILDLILKYQPKK